MERNKPKVWDIIMLDINYMSEDYKKEYNILKNVTEGGSKKIKKVSMDEESRKAIRELNTNYLMTEARGRMIFLLTSLGCDLETEISEGDR